LTPPGVQHFPFGTSFFRKKLGESLFPGGLSRRGWVIWHGGHNTGKLFIAIVPTKGTIFSQGVAQWIIFPKRWLRVILKFLHRKKILPQKGLKKGGGGFFFNRVCCS